MSGKVRVRFAPSPTGPLHIGGVRTALFNYLFAKKERGDFILRIEDTDQVRFVPGAEGYIVESLRWLGIVPEEGIGSNGQVLDDFRQSSRKYDAFVNELVSKNFAYYAFDSPDELDSLRKKYESEGRVFKYDISTRNTLKNSLAFSKEEAQKLLDSGRPHVIRFRIPENETVKVTDLIRGDLVFNSAELDDKILFKSDGLPTYHLANIVDDHLMKISHVIRGEEWLPSLPLHVLLYKSFGWEMPAFAHLPLILKPNGQGKLSKRDGDKLGFPVFPLQWKDPETGEISSGYKESGYFPEAVVNMLAFLGWNPGTEQEIFSLGELAVSFSLERVGKSGARFDPEKVKWYNQQYLKMKTDAELAGLVKSDLSKQGISSFENLTKIIALVRERLVFPQEFWSQASYFYKAPEVYDRELRKKAWREDTPGIIVAIKSILEQADDFSSAGLETNIKRFVADNNLGFGRVASPLRLLIVGSGMGPHLFDILEIIGKKETIRRIDKGLNALGKTSGSDPV